MGRVWTPAARLARRILEGPPLVDAVCPVCGSPTKREAATPSRYAICDRRECFDEVTDGWIV
jgi:hypothetical protein